MNNDFTIYPPVFGLIVKVHVFEVGYRTQPMFRQRQLLIAH
jgi:hypothetical protein